MIIFKRTTTKKILSYLLIPILLFEKFMELFHYVPFLLNKYHMVACDIDNNMNLGIADRMKHDITEVDMSYIKNKYMRNSLLITGIFKKWIIYKGYTMKERGYNSPDSQREVIYITKEKIVMNDPCFHYRINDSDFNRKTKKDNNFYKIESQIFVVIAKKGDKYKELSKERDTLYNYKKERELEKEVKRMIKKHNLFSNRSLRYYFNDIPVIHIVSKQDRVDLMKKILDNAVDDEERNKLVNYKTWKGSDALFKKPKEYAVSDEMKTLLEKWEDLSKYDRYYKIMKIKKGIKK